MIARKEKSRKHRRYRYTKKQRGCLNKRVFKTFRDAEEMIGIFQILSLTQNKRKQKQASRLHWYVCPYCDDFHITKGIK